MPCEMRHFLTLAAFDDTHSLPDGSMHIPDRVLSPEVCIATGVISVGAVGYGLRRLKSSLADRTVPLTGMMSALIFAGQMVNFPISLFGIPSVSGHLMGGVLAASILGPWAGCVAITLVLLVQCLLFADGGISALGANVLNMGVVGAIGGYAVLATVRKALGGGNRGTLVGVVIASWLSVVAASALFCAEFQMSYFHRQYDLRAIFTLMVSFHSAIGIGEALITGGIISFVLMQRPDLIYQPNITHCSPGAVTRVGGTVAAGLVVALAVAAFLSPFASSYADGLEAVGERKFSSALEHPPTTLVLPDYEVPLPISGWQESPFWQKVSVSLAGIFGTIAVAVIAWLLDQSLKPRPTPVVVKHDN